MLHCLPQDCIVEIFLDAGLRAGVRLLSTCKDFRQIWDEELDSPTKKGSELLHFKLCQQHGLCPPPLNCDGFSSFRHVDEYALGKFPLPQGKFGFNSWRECCKNRFPKSVRCVRCGYEHKGITIMHHPKPKNSEGKYPCCGTSKPRELIEQLKAQEKHNKKSFISFSWNPVWKVSEQHLQRVKILKEAEASPFVKWGCAMCREHMSVYFIDYASGHPWS